MYFKRFRLSSWVETIKWTFTKMIETTTTSKTTEINHVVFEMIKLYSGRRGKKWKIKIILTAVDLWGNTSCSCRVIKLFDWNGIKQMARSFHIFFFLHFSLLTCGTTSPAFTHLWLMTCGFRENIIRFKNKIYSFVLADSSECIRAQRQGLSSLLFIRARTAQW